MSVSRDDGRHDAPMPRAAEHHGAQRLGMVTLECGEDEMPGGADPRSWVRSLPRIVSDDAEHADYVSLERIASGGMAVVERALQCSVDREVALKRPYAEHDARAVAALVQEARALAHLDHPSIPTVYALGRDGDDLPVMAMKYLEGVTWHALLRDPHHPLWRSLPGDHLTIHLAILARVADAVEHAHQRGWLHRDIKPSNVMVTPRGEVYLLDWGLAIRLPVEAQRDGAWRAPSGTPRYMAPEMVRGVGPWLTPRTDVYLLGASLHELLTGRARHEGATLGVVLVAALRSEHHEYGSRVPPALAALANDATHPEPERRPASARAFKRRLDTLREEAQVAAREHHRGA